MHTLYIVLLMLISQIPVVQAPIVQVPTQAPTQVPANRCPVKWHSGPGVKVTNKGTYVEFDPQAHIALTAVCLNGYRIYLNDYAYGTRVKVQFSNKTGFEIVSYAYQNIGE